jgi:hypothetical protein
VIDDEFVPPFQPPSATVVLQCETTFHIEKQRHFHYNAERVKGNPIGPAAAASGPAKQGLMAKRSGKLL